MINKILGIEYPLIQGAMARIAKAELVSAVSNAGALGVIASGGMSSEELREEIRKCKKLTAKPFAVNLMLMMKNINELIDVVIEENVKIVTTGAGTPRPYMEKLKAADVIVVAVVPNAKIAKRMEEIGVDIIVAEGCEAGGHVGEVTTMTLIPQVVDAVNIPVVAAGGIADNRGVLASFALGAQGVQVGTAFLATKECPISENYKQAIKEASDTSTIIVGGRKGVAQRGIKNEFTKKYLELEYSDIDREQLEHLTLGALEKAVAGDVENGSVMSGAIAGLVKDITTVPDVVATLFEGTDELIERLREVQKINSC